MSNRAYEDARRERIDLKNAQATTLYRVYDGWNQLLYVGITFDLEKRFVQHKRNADWFPLMHRVSTEPHPHRLSAMSAEAAAIRAERPIFNFVGVQHSIAHRTRKQHESGQPCTSRACRFPRCVAARS